MDVSSVLQSIGTQLTKRFPNLVLPHVSTLTMLSASDCIEHLVHLPLHSLPPTAQVMFIAIDGLPENLFDFAISVRFIHSLKIYSFPKRF